MEYILQMTDIRYRMEKNSKGGPKMKKKMSVVRFMQASAHGISIRMSNYKYVFCGGGLLSVRT